MFQLDLKSGTPICDQIVSGFIRLKAIGVLKPDDQLPSVRALASKFSVNPNTIQKAYAILESKGIIYSVKGKGSFILDDANSYLAIKESALSDVAAAAKNALEVGISKNEIISVIEKESGVKV